MSALPVPTGFRILVEMMEYKAKTSGGIYIPEDTKKLEETANIVAKVRALGPDAYKDSARFPQGAWCGEGDFVMFRPYSGTRFKHDGTEFRLINDDTVEAVVDDPNAVERV